jgi:hypothetical protein
LFLLSTTISPLFFSILKSCKQKVAIVSLFSHTH